MAAPILNDRDLVLQASTYRSKNTLVTVTADAGAFLTAKNGGATLPENILLTATPNNVYTESAVYTWHYALSATSTTWVLLGTGKTQTITKTGLLAIIGSSTQIQYRCTVTENLLDTSYGFFTVLYSKEASEPIVVDISRTNAVIPCTSDGTPTGYSDTDTAISVSRGGVALAYNANGGVANTFKVAIQADNTSRTVGTVTGSGNTYSISGITNIALDIATVVFVVTVYDASGVITSPTIAKKITYTKVTNGVKGDPGIQGNPGQRSVTISAYKWIEAGTAIGSFAADVTYTWADKSVSARPAGWSDTATAPTATSIGRVLYQLNLLVTDLTGTALTNTLNWSAAVTNTIGYRLDGSIGPQGNSARVAYIVTTSSTPPATPTAVSGDAAPTGWSFSSTSTLSSGQYMYQSDGILATGGNIAWGNPYLSNLKVGSLSAISLNAGVLTSGTLTAGTVFAGELNAATGTFTGALSGATGEFAGTLRAGVLDLSTFAGISYTYTSNASFTVPSGKTSMRVTLIGAGGGGGGGDNRYTWPTTGGGGGGGGMVIQLYSGLTVGTTFNVVIGIGGNAGTPADGVYAYGGSGTDGEPTQLRQGTAVVLSAPGGGYGSSSGPANQAGGLHEGAAGNSYATAGGLYYWEPDDSGGGGYGAPGGKGGNSRFGTGGLGGSAATGYRALVGSGYGAGGGGGGNFYFTTYQGSQMSNNGTIGAKGTNGYAIIEFFDPNTVVLQTAFDTLKSALTRQGIAVT
jgi:hypothetical protein